MPTPRYETVYPLRRDPAGTCRPFPTIYWLTDPALDKQLADLERQGIIRQLEAALRDDPALLARFHDDHHRYIAQRWALLTAEDRALVEATPSLLDAFRGRGIAGTADFSTIKCLHAHIAHHLADRNTVAELLIDRAWIEL